MRLAIPRSVAGYATAIGTSLSATLLTWWLTPDVVGLGSLFFAAVMVSAWQGGLGPGLVATGISSFSTAYVFFHPAGSLVLGSDDIVRLGVFIAVAVLISSLHTRTRESEQAALRARKEAERANCAKDRFLAVVSHELRNPLNPVLTIASIWERDTSLPEEARQDMAVVRRNVELEARLIEDLLDISRITAGKLVLRRQVVELACVIRDAVAVCEQQAREKRLNLHVDPAAGEGLMVEGDPVRLRQIIWNLLTNAVKFTPQGGSVEVFASVSGGPTGAGVELAVRDTGMGMDAETLAKVFEPFHQGAGDVARRFGGLGLGLAIAKALTEAHGGVLWAQSDGRGRGSCFHVRLPQAAARSSPAALPAHALHPISASVAHAPPSMR